jgi:hypothetical protein
MVDFRITWTLGLVRLGNRTYQEEADTISGHVIFFVFSLINDKGDLKNPMEFESTYGLGAEFPDATHTSIWQ